MVDDMPGALLISRFQSDLAIVRWYDLPMVDQKIIIAPSLLCANFAKLQEEVDSVSSFVDWFQIDVMDGHFVPNLSFGAPVVKCIKTDIPLDIHLMVTNPGDRLAEFLALDVHNISFHQEAVKSTAERKELIARIHEENTKVGIALNPESPLDSIDDVVGEVDLVLLMSVHPGFGGQEFIEAVVPKIIALRKEHPTLMIQVDGGINDRTAPLALTSGATNLVVGTHLFSSANREATIAKLRAR